MNGSGHKHISDLIPLLIHDEQFAAKAIYDFSITVTEMFRDPDFYRAVRQSVVPYLRTFPFLRFGSRLHYWGRSPIGGVVVAIA
jgi:chemotaxis protein methyltransferase CheR